MAEKKRNFRRNRRRKDAGEKREGQSESRHREASKRGPVTHRNQRQSGRREETVGGGRAQNMLEKVELERRPIRPQEKRDGESKKCRSSRGGKVRVAVDLTELSKKREETTRC